MGTFDIALRDNGTPTFDISLAGATPGGPEGIGFWIFD